MTNNEVKTIIEKMDQVLAVMEEILDTLLDSSVKNANILFDGKIEEGD